MDTIKKGKFEFLVDLQTTTQYYQNEITLCDCDDCKYYYEHIKGAYDDLDEFLREFGVDITKPDNVTYLYPDGEKKVYMPAYTVSGKIIKPRRNGKEISNPKPGIWKKITKLRIKKIKIGNLEIIARCDRVPTGLEDEYFTLTVFPVVL